MHNKWDSFLLVLALAIVFHSSSTYCELSHDNFSRVGIIGAGAGGSATAYFLRQLAGEEIDIEIFEKTDIVGGRVKSIDFAGEHVELGGSIYHKENKLYADLVKQGKFDTFDPIHGKSDPKIKKPSQYNEEQSLMGIWNGKEFLFEESTSKWVNIIQGLWRYGMDGKYVGDEADKTLHKFLKIYELLERKSYKSVEELLRALDLYDLTQVNLKDHLFSNHLCDYNQGTYCNEIVTALTRINYGQSMDLNALVGLIALIGSTDDVLSVVGGNNKVLEYAIWKSQSLLRYQSSVTKITKFSSDDNLNSYYSISYIDKDGNNQISEKFDKIVIATPLEFANIEFEGFELPSKLNS